MIKIKSAGLLILISLLFIGFSSCSDDDDKAASNVPSELLKTWYLGDGSSITFNADGTGVFVEEEDGEPAGFSAKKSVRTKTITRAKTSYPFTYTYNAGNKQITMTMKGAMEIWTIVSLTEEILKIEDSEGDMIQFSKTETSTPDVPGSNELAGTKWGYAGKTYISFTETMCTIYSDDDSEGESAKYKYVDNQIFFWGEGGWTGGRFTVLTLTDNYINFKDNEEGELVFFFRIPEERNSIGPASYLYNKKWSTPEDSNINQVITITFNENGQMTYKDSETPETSFEYSYEESTHMLYIKNGGAGETWEITNLTPNIVYFKVHEDGDDSPMMEFRVLP